MAVLTIIKIYICASKNYTHIKVDITWKHSIKKCMELWSTK